MVVEVVEEEVEQETTIYIYQWCCSHQNNMICTFFLSLSNHRDGLHTKVISGMREGWGP